jgi:hypothetical protein
MTRPAGSGAPDRWAVEAPPSPHHIGDPMPGIQTTTTDGIQIELTRNGLWVEARRPDGGWQSAFIPAPDLRGLLVDREVIQAT